MPSLREIIRARLNLVGEADERFVAEIRKTETALYNAIIGLLAEFSERGTLRSSDSDLELFRRLQEEVDRIVNNSTYKDKVRAYLPNFDKVERLNIQLYGIILDRDLRRLPISAERRLLIDTVTQQLLSPQSIQLNVERPIHGIIYKHIAYGSTIDEARQELTTFIKGDPGKNGYLSRYAQQIARDAVTQYNGAINQKMFENYELDGFRYVGSLIDTSRQNCIELVNGTGRFSEFAIQPGLYRTEDLPQIIAAASNRQGWIPGTNRTNFFQHRGGFNCRHEAIPVVLGSRAEEQIGRAA